MNRRGALVTGGVILAVVLAVLLVGAGFLSDSQDPGNPERSDNQSDGDTELQNGSDSDQGGTEAVQYNKTAVPGELDAGHNGFAEFVDVTSDAGLTYETELFSGAISGNYGPYVVDFDNDGDEDVLLLGGEYPALFENTGGAYERYRTFEVPDVSTAHFLDYDNSGARDLLLVPRGSTPILYENVDSEFVQRDVGFDAKLGYSTTVTSADFTGNGCLDLFVGDYSIDDRVNNTERVLMAKNHPDVRPTPGGDPTNHLFAGDCEMFTDITEEAGLDRPGQTLAASAVDFTGNGHVDIHVGNDFSRDYVYANQGNGTFEAVDLGPASDRNAMASVARDVTGDHRPDIFVTNIYYEEYDAEAIAELLGAPLPHGNNLFRNEGGGEFQDVAPEHGLEKGSWGWGTTVADYTNDGHLDIIHGAQYIDAAGVENHSDIFRTLQVWKGKSESWEKVDGFEVGFTDHNVRGVARVDYDNDGVLDLVTVGNPTPSGIPGANRSFLYENTHENNESLQLWVRNPEGIERNAHVYIETDERAIQRILNARSGLLSQDSRLVHVGLANENLQRVIVKWPDGTQTSYDELQEGNRYILKPDTVERVT